MKRHIISAGLSILAAAMLLTVPVSAATEEDVFAAMAEAGLSEAFIQDARNRFRNEPHDETGMTINGQYRTYEEWAQYIRENGGAAIYQLIADAMGVDVEVLALIYGEIQVPEDYVPSVEQEKPFAEMTLEEKRAYVDSLPEEERAVFLASLSPEERNSILKQLDPELKQEAAGALIELGEEMGMNIAVEDVDELRFSVRDDEGNLIDSAGFGLTVDPTGWDTTVPVLLGAAMILTASGGILWMIRRGKYTEE